MTHTETSFKVPELLSQIDRLRARDVMSRRAQWMVVIDAMTSVFGGLPALQGRGAAISFVAQPADDACRCQSEAIHSRLVAVRQTYLQQLRLVERAVGARAREPLTAVWTQLTQIVADIDPSHPHAGFVFDFAGGVLGCWHDWTCLPCTRGAPCLLLDLVTEGPLDVGAFPWVVGVDVVGVTKQEGELERGDPRRSRARSREELCSALAQRMHELRLSPPCELLTEPHDMQAGS